MKLRWEERSQGKTVVDRPLRGQGEAVGRKPIDDQRKDTLFDANDSNDRLLL